MLVMKHLQKVYRTHLIETHALRDFSISVGEGEFLPTPVRCTVA